MLDASDSDDLSAFPTLAAVAVTLTDSLAGSGFGAAAPGLLASGLVSLTISLIMCFSTLYRMKKGAVCATGARARGARSVREQVQGVARTRRAHAPHSGSDISMTFSSCLPNFMTVPCGFRRHARVGHTPRTVFAWTGRARRPQLARMAELQTARRSAGLDL